MCISHVRHFALLDVPASRRPALAPTKMIADIPLDVFDLPKEAEARQSFGLSRVIAVKLPAKMA
jgi:hypothetical protein